MESVEMGNGGHFDTSALVFEDVLEFARFD